nr:MAG TPA: hypothetical protein [Caudoviricetes sp.]
MIDPEKQTASKFQRESKNGNMYHIFRMSHVNDCINLSQ